MSLTIRVRNDGQRILWEELDGQISDGMWENARPMDHWRVWCDAEVIVDPTNVGVNFYARKDNYDFTNKQLLAVIGERMIEQVRAEYPHSNYGWTQLMIDLRDLKQIIKTQSRPVFVPTQEPSVPEGTFGGLEVLL